MPWDSRHASFPVGDRAEREHRLSGGTWVPAVDIRESPASYVVVAELAGLGPADFAVAATPATLTLSGRRPARPIAGSQYLRVERGQGEFSRTFTFPDPLDTSRISADFRDGLLTITIPRRVPDANRRIEIG